MLAGAFEDAVVDDDAVDIESADGAAKCGREGYFAGRLLQYSRNLSRFNWRAAGLAATGPAAPGLLEITPALLRLVTDEVAVIVGK